MKKTITALSLALTISLVPIEAQAKQPTNEYLEYLDGICETYNICPELVQALIFYESSWTPTAKNGSCIGLGQINTKAHKSRMKELGVTDLENPYQNMLVTVDYLSDLFNEYEEAEIVLDAYRGNKHSIEWYEAGNISKYADNILTMSERLEREDGK